MNRPVRHMREPAAPAQDESPLEQGKTPLEHDKTSQPSELRRTEEFRTFIFLTVIMAPALAVVGVGGYGLIVWIYQMIAGPPGSGM